MLDLSPSSPAMLKGQQHMGRLPLAADRRQWHSCPSTAWMPSTFTETERVLYAMANAADTLPKDIVLARAPLMISLFKMQWKLL